MFTCSHGSLSFSICFLAATVEVQAQTSGALCIHDLMCPSVGGQPGKCVGCPKKTEDGGTTGDCEFTVPDRDDNASTSKDGKGKDGKNKDGKNKKKSKRRRLKSSKSSSGDDDDDTDSGGINGDPLFTGSCCDCNCIKKSPEESCTCICYGFVDPTDGTTTGGTSKGKSKDGKNKKKSRRRRHLQSDDEEDLTVHDEESHVRSRLAKRTDTVDAEGGWHSWLLNSLWGSDDEELEVPDQSDRKLKKKKKKTASSVDGDDDDDDDTDGGSGGGGGGGGGGGDDGGNVDCTPPPTQCFYIKRFEGNGATIPEENQCQVNTYGRCATNRNELAMAL